MELLLLEHLDLLLEGLHLLLLCLMLLCLCLLLRLLLGLVGMDELEESSWVSWLPL